MVSQNKLLTEVVKKQGHHENQLLDHTILHDEQAVINDEQAVINDEQAVINDEQRKFNSEVKRYMKRGRRHRGVKKSHRGRSRTPRKIIDGSDSEDDGPFSSDNSNNQDDGSEPQDDEGAFLFTTDGDAEEEYSPGDAPDVVPKLGEISIDDAPKLDESKSQSTGSHAAVPDSSTGNVPKLGESKSAPTIGGAKPVDSSTGVDNTRTIGGTKPVDSSTVVDDIASSSNRYCPIGGGVASQEAVSEDTVDPRPDNETGLVNEEPQDTSFIPFNDDKENTDPAPKTVTSTNGPAKGNDDDDESSVNSFFLQVSPPSVPTDDDHTLSSLLPSLPTTQVGVLHGGDVLSTDDLLNGDLEVSFDEFGTTDATTLHYGDGDAEHYGTDPNGHVGDQEGPSLFQRVAFPYQLSPIHVPKKKKETDEPELEEVVELFDGLDLEDIDWDCVADLDN